MQIALYQQDIKWLDPAANCRKVESVLLQHPEIDLLVMPEMCLTGFVTEPKPGDLPAWTEVESQLLALAAAHQTALCGSVAVVAPEGSRNRAFFVTPEGQSWWADKRHLFTPGGERKGYTPGAEQRVVEWRGLRFLLLVCYDLRFPVWARNTPALNYDVMVCVANWPQPRRLAWDVLLAARAIENQAYVVGVNRVGVDTMCAYDGGTCAVHPYGHRVAQVEGNAEGVCVFEPDMAKLRDYRHKFPSLGDADDFILM